MEGVVLMLYPKHYDLQPIILGYPWEVSFTYEVSGTALDFTDYTMSMLIMSDYETAAALTLNDTDEDITLGTDGTVSIEIGTTDQAASLSIGKWKYVIVLTYPSGTEAYPILTGNLPIIDINGV